MAKFSVKELIQDDSKLFKLLLDSPKHAVVLNIIAGAIPLYHRTLQAVVKSHDLGLQQDIALITRMLKAEAADRVAIQSEHLMLDGFERLHGDKALNSLLTYQTAAIADWTVSDMADHPGQPTMEHLFESAGVLRVPTWGVEFGRANVTALAGLRVMRHEVFRLTRETHRAYHGGKHQESWRLKLQAKGAQARLARYADRASRTSFLKVVKSLHGDDEVKRVADWARSHTRLSEFEALRNKIQALRFEGRIYSRSSSAKNLESA